MARKNVVKEAIDRIFESEVKKMPRFRDLPEGQQEVVKGRFVEYMVMDLAFDFLECEDVDLKVKIAKFFSDYGGYKPRVDAKELLPDNPYEGKSLEELEKIEAEMRLISDE